MFRPFNLRIISTSQDGGAAVRDPSLPLDLDSQVVPLSGFYVPQAHVSSSEPEPETSLFSFFRGIFSAAFFFHMLPGCLFPIDLSAQLKRHGSQLPTTGRCQLLLWPRLMFCSVWASSALSRHYNLEKLLLLTLGILICQDSQALCKFC